MVVSNLIYQLCMPVFVFDWWCNIFLRFLGSFEMMCVKFRISHRLNSVQSSIPCFVFSLLLCFHYLGQFCLVSHLFGLIGPS